VRDKEMAGKEEVERREHISKMVVFV